MNTFMPIKLALKTLKTQKLRSFLTILGIIIGVGSVIAVISFGQAAMASVRASMESRGANTISVFPGSNSQRGVSNSMNAQTLTLKDAEVLAKECPSVGRVTPLVRASGQIVYGNKNWQSSVEGRSEDYFSITGWKLSQGSFFTSQDAKNRASLCVIGKQVADELFEGGDQIVGKTIRIRKIPFMVVGVLESQGGMGSQDNVVIVPYTTALQRLSKSQYISGITIQAKSRELVDDAVDEIKAVLRQRHKLADNQEDDFNVRTREDAIKMMSQTLTTLTTFLAAVAAVSLLVGGIGIMNIMLVSVSERTREIGIRMAIGARKSDILYQFLTESVVLSLIGGLFGIVIGCLIAYFGGKAANFPTSISFVSIVIAFLFSAVIGIIFGYLPASKASNLEPIAALRNE